MKEQQKAGVFALGLALFAMFFGAGNVVFPLMVGVHTSSNYLFAVIGLCITAVMVPLAGVIGVILFDGDYKRFLFRMGSVPGMSSIIMCMILIGPFACIPRCIAMSYGATKWYFPALSLMHFSLASTLIIFVLTFQRNSLMKILGKWLSPLKVASLIMVIIGGLFGLVSYAPTQLSEKESFLFGLLEGYNTLDLLGSLFFSGLIVSALSKTESGELRSPQERLKMALQAAFIGGGLLGAIYLGFAVIAARQSSHLLDVNPDELLSALAEHVLGSNAGILASATVSLACLTTALTLTAIFSEFIKDLMRIPYLLALIMTSITTFLMANLGFSAIIQLIFPILQVLYPTLITLTVFNIAHGLWGLRMVKTPVALTFIAAAWYYWFPLIEPYLR